MTITVMVPTYRRPHDLRRCLDALTMQWLPADEVIVVHRDTDTETSELLATGAWPALPLRTVIVSEPGQVHALNVGLSEVRTDVVAITDDDAAPHRDWTQRIMTRFAEDSKIGGVGGRDYLHVGSVLQDGRARKVGRVPKLGKHIGNHHIGYGAARDVDVLKGVNGSYRTAALRPIGFDTRLRGTGAQVHWEIGLGIAMRRAGWRLVYDPSIAVDHYLAPRFDEDQRHGFNPMATENAAFNEALVRLEFLSWPARALFLAWAIVIGTRLSPGLVQWFRLVPRQRSIAAPRVAAAIRGRILAWNETCKNARGPSFGEGLPSTR